MRSFEHFKQIQIGMLAEMKRKTLPAIARMVKDGDPQALHHLVAYAPWQKELLARGFQFDIVLADSLYGESTACWEAAVPWQAPHLHQADFPIPQSWCSRSE